MNFKQRFLYVLSDGPICEYALNLCLCLFNKKTCAMLLNFFTYYSWKPMHMGSTKFKPEISGNYCEFVKRWKHGSVVIGAHAYSK